MNPYYEPWIGQWCVFLHLGGPRSIGVRIARLLAIEGDEAVLVCAADGLLDSFRAPLRRIEGTLLGSCWESAEELEHSGCIRVWAEIFDLAEDFNGSPGAEVSVYLHSNHCVDKRRLSVTELLSGFDFKSGGGL